MLRTFVASIGADAPPEQLRAAVEHRAGAPASLVREGRLTIAVTGAAPAARCVLDGTVDAPGEIARAAGLDPALAIEPLLAAAHERLGPRLLGHLRGAFALLLWDAAGDLLVVRDQLGHRGAVWARSGGGVLVAGEPADLLAALPATPPPDEIAVAHWLTISGLPADRTLFAGVQRVRAGHAARIGANARVDVERWWLPRPPVADGLDRAAAVSRVQGALRDAVERATAEPGPHATAVLLSGGLDSSAVAAFASAAGVRRTYSAVFPAFPRADETPLIDATVGALGLASTRVTVSGGGIVDAALEYVERWLDPPVSPNLSFWLPLLRRAAGDGVEVVLDGQAGDELFGLSPFLLADRLRRGNLWGAVGLIGRVPGANHRPPPRAVARWLHRYGLRGALPPRLAATRRAAHAVPPGAPSWLAPRLARAAFAVDPPESWKALGRPRWWAHIVSATADGMGPTLAFDHIRRRDALCGVRSRHPLADPRVVECVLGLPPELAFHPRHSRPLLRDAVAGVIPDAVRLRRAKSDFDGPFHAALAGADAGIVAELLGAPDARTRSFVRPQAVARELLAGSPDGASARGMWGVQLWRLLTAELWLRALEDPAAVPNLRDRGVKSGAMVISRSVGA